MFTCFLVICHVSVREVFLIICITGSQLDGPLKVDIPEKASKETEISDTRRYFYLL